MPRPRSNKSPRKNSGTPFGKRSDAEKSFRKKGTSSRSDQDSTRSFSKPSGFRKSTGTGSFGPPASGFRKKREESSGSRPERRDKGGREKPFQNDRSKSFRSNSGGPRKFSEGFTRNRDSNNEAKPKPYGADRGKRPFHKGKNESGEGAGDDKKTFHKSGDFEQRTDKSANNPDKKSFRNEERKSFVQSRVLSLSDFTRPGKKPKDEVPAEQPVKVSKESSKKGPVKKEEPAESADALTRLNKFIANSGVGSRRDADKLITMGLISVNGVTITQLGTKVKKGDVIRYEDRILKAEKPVYILLNKPKGFITTTEDPQERNTVMGLVAGACKERVYPVGRLDRNTTGLLLLTNDGDLADKLTHPSYKAKKVYKVELDKPLTKNDLQKIVDGVHLEEGRAMVDDVAVISDDRKTVGLEIHIGWNRVVRRIFETLGYDVLKLDRSVYAGLDKKDTPRGQWRFLKPEEIVMLKHFK